MKKRNIFAIFLLLLFALSLPAQAKPQGSIYVDASSNLDLQPDVVEFNVIVTTKDRNSLENASIANKETSGKVYQALNTMIDKTNGDYIKTIDYSARPTYYYSNGKQIFDRFEVTNTITVHTKKITEVGTFIDKALNLGATNIGNIDFKLEDQNTYCNELLSVSLPESVAIIGQWAFSDCRKLSSLNLPDKITSIGDGAFKDCWALKELTLPSSLTEIGRWAFAGCNGLSEIVIPQSVNTIEMCVFTDCGGLKINCERKKPAFGLPKKWSKDWLGNNEKPPVVTWGFVK